MLGGAQYYGYGSLPLGYQQVVLNGITYFLFDGVYYQPYIYGGKRCIWWSRINDTWPNQGVQLGRALLRMCGWPIRYVMGDRCQRQRRNGPFWADRTKAALAHVEAGVVQAKEVWNFILAGADNDNEWIVV
ncbi:MAG: hypothetical protein NTY19_41425 [Planctomycetota bacterium]|nr:hypothetical protein [Planctomycetota bacterium]